MPPTRYDGESVDAVLTVLSHSTRRRILRSLQGTESTTVVDVLSDLLDDERPTDPTARRERLRVALCHVHLPKMDEAGVLDYDRSSGSIRTTETTTLACDLLARAVDRSVS